MYFLLAYVLLFGCVLAEPLDLECVNGCECDEGIAYCAKLGFTTWPYHPLHRFNEIKSLDLSDNTIGHLPTIDLRINLPSSEVLNLEGNNFPCYAIHYLEKSATVISDCGK